MTQVIELQGTEKRLYRLVAPLVMDPKVLKQNYNYPFRTSESFVWFVAVKGKEVVGFIPLEYRRQEAIINNYYIKDNDAEVLRTLLEEVVAKADEEKQLSAVAFVEHQELFREQGFAAEKEWRRYVKMYRES